MFMFANRVFFTRANLSGQSVLLRRLDHINLLGRPNQGET